MIDNTGTLRLAGNWLRAGWVVSFNSAHTGTVIDAGGNLAGTAPGFLDLAAQDFHLAESSACRDAGVALDPAAAAHAPALEYLRHRRSWPRSAADAAPDLGAHEFQAYAVWRYQYFGAGGDALAAADPLADPDGDSATNLQEFAHDTGPLDAASWAAPAATLVTLGDAVSHAAYAFPRRASPHGLAYTVQTSPDLTTWSDGWTLVDTGVAAGATLVETGAGLQSRVADPAAPGPCGFFRLRLVLR